jgi:hypothetical protein
MVWTQQFKDNTTERKLEQSAESCVDLITMEECSDIITILHQNVCSLHNKTTELEIWLDSELNQIDVICLTEHWLNYQNLNRTKKQNLKLVSAFNTLRTGDEFSRLWRFFFTTLKDR